VPDPIGALVAYGLDDARRADLDAKRRREPASPEAEIGRIIRVDRGESNVVTERGVLRVLSDSTRSQGDIAPATGDWVLVDEVGDKHPVIVAVADRRKTLVRRDPSEAIVDQVMVANVDTVMIVHGLDRPFPPGRLERFLIIAWDSGAQPVLVLTKADLPELVEDTVATVHALAPDTPVVLVRRDDVASIDAVRAWIPAGTTAALVGASGAGKSTLVNRLRDDESLAVTEVRASDAKGRHTTTSRALLLVPGGGCVIDTPGVRSLGIWDAEDSLHRVFADIELLAATCRFVDCAHDREPGCAVQSAVACGEIAPRRVERFRALLAELATLRERERSRGRSEKSRAKRTSRIPTIEGALEDMADDLEDLANDET
jgi:ribosome biogenesis GTPase